MNKYYYDFHIHSCLSPCADDDMTPNNIAGMCTLAGLNIAALTDHNSSKNCPAFFAAAKKQGIIPIAGMELTTAEDIHIVCLFRELDGALAFDKFVEEHRVMKIPNRPDIFGNQYIMDGEDEVIGTDEYFLPAATDIMVDDVPTLVHEYGGICYPAHIDRQANGIIATLGTLPDIKGFDCAEFNDGENRESYMERFPILKEKRILVSSDAHYLWNIRDKEAYIEIDDEPYSGRKVTDELFRILGGEGI